MTRLIFISLTLVGLSACTTFPALDDAVSPTAQAADYPDLVPLEPLLAARAPERAADATPEAIRATLEGRLARLQARATRLRGPVLSRSERARLAERPG